MAEFNLLAERTGGRERSKIAVKQTISFRRGAAVSMTFGGTASLLTQFGTVE